MTGNAETNNDPLPVDGMHGGFLLDNLSLAFETTLLFSETAFQNRVGCEDLDSSRQFLAGFHAVNEHTTSYF